MNLNRDAINHLRTQFPALNRKVGDNRLPVHFDNPAGTQVPQVVIDAVQNYYTTMNANKGGVFATSQRSDQMLEAARLTVADFLNAPRTEEIVFGPNMTTLCFSLSRAIGNRLTAGDEIVLTVLDHDANISPWLRMAADNGVNIRWVDINPNDCTLDIDSLEAALSERTRLVAVVHAANATGTITPVKQITEMAHAAGAWCVVDAVQSAPHIPIDVQDIGCDFLLCSAYKFYGPHIGILWGRYDLLAELPVYQVRPAKNIPPYRWETGTQSHETIVATAAALDYLAGIGHDYGNGYHTHFANFSGRRLDFKVGMAVLADYERELAIHLINMLQSLPGVEIKGITDVQRFDERVPTVAMTLQGYTPRQITEHLAARDIYTWDGNYYALKLMERLGKQDTGGMVRIGLAHYNTHEEIDRLESALRELD